MGGGGGTWACGAAAGGGVCGNGAWGVWDVWGVVGAWADGPGEVSGGGAPPVRPPPYSQTISSTVAAPTANPARPAKGTLQLFRSPAMAYSVKWTGVPALTKPATVIASQLVRRTQPCEVVLPMVLGSGVPWMP